MVPYLTNIVQVDTMIIQIRPVVYLVYEATHFSSAQFLRNQSTADIFPTFEIILSLSYLGPPDFLSVYQGSAYVSTKMQKMLLAEEIILFEAPIELPNTIGGI